MLNILKNQEPDFFTEFKKRYTPSNWKEYQDIQEKEGIYIKEELKLHILNKEQGKKCGYCERPVDLDDGHIEHIKAKGQYPRLFQEYNNLIVSCMSKTSCGNYKDGKGKDLKPNYYEKFISPVLEDPQEYFVYDLKTGEVMLKDGLDDQLKEKELITKSVLNLNERSLVAARKAYLMILETSLSQPEILEYLDEFPTLVNYFRSEFNI